MEGMDDSASDPNQNPSPVATGPAPPPSAEPGPRRRGTGGQFRELLDMIKTDQFGFSFV